MREDFESILQEFGHNILLVRSSTKIKCSCWNEKTREASSNCPICFGLGFVPKVEKHTVRVQDASIAISYPGMGERSKIGEMAVPGFFYFFKHDVKVELGDLILEVDWSPTGKPIYNGGYISAVNHIDRKRWERGEIAFQKVYTEDQPVEKELRGVSISNASGITNYELTYRSGE
jgi:hypothetical protein